MFGKKKTELVFLIKDTPEGKRAAIKMSCGRHEIVLEPGCKFTDSSVKPVLTKLGFKPATYIIVRKTQKLQHTLRADDVLFVGVGVGNVLVEFNVDTAMLSRVTLFNQNEFSKRDVLSKCLWLGRLEKLLGMPANSNVNADFRIFHQREADKYYDFTTAQLRPDTTAFYGANGSDSSQYLQSQFVLTRGLKIFATMQTNSFFDGVEYRCIYPEGVEFA